MAYANNTLSCHSNRNRMAPIFTNKQEALNFLLTKRLHETTIDLERDEMRQRQRPEPSGNYRSGGYGFVAISIALIVVLQAIVIFFVFRNNAKYLM